MDFYSIAYETDYKRLEIDAENFTIELAIFESLWAAWEKFVEIFYFQLYMENKEEKPNEKEMQEKLIKFFWNDVHTHLLGNEYLGDKTKDNFFENALSNDPEKSKDYLDYCLMHTMDIICKYACDAYICYCDKPNDISYVYFLNEANYFKGLLVASHADKTTEKDETRQKMIELANKRHQKNQLNNEKNLIEVRKIWIASNWKSYTECANEIYKKQLINEDNYRKIYDLVSRAAKMKS